MYQSRRPTKEAKQSVSSGGPQNGESDFSSTSGGSTSSVQNHHRCVEGGHDIGEVDRRCRRWDRGEWQRGAGEREMVCLCCAGMLRRRGGGGGGAEWEGGDSSAWGSECRVGETSASSYR